MKLDLIFAKVNFCIVRESRSCMVEPQQMCDLIHSTSYSSSTLLVKPSPSSPIFGSYHCDNCKVDNRRLLTQSLSRWVNGTDPSFVPAIL